MLPDSRQYLELYLVELDKTETQEHRAPLLFLTKRKTEQHHHSCIKLLNTSSQISLSERNIRPAKSAGWLSRAVEDPQQQIQKWSASVYQ